MYKNKDSLEVSCQKDFKKIAYKVKHLNESTDNADMWFTRFDLSDFKFDEKRVIEEFNKQKEEQQSYNNKLFNYTHTFEKVTSGKLGDTVYGVKKTVDLYGSIDIKCIILNFSMRKYIMKDKSRYELPTAFICKDGAPTISLLKSSRKLAYNIYFRYTDDNDDNDYEYKYKYNKDTNILSEIKEEYANQVHTISEYIRNSPSNNYQLDGLLKDDEITWFRSEDKALDYVNNCLDKSIEELEF